MEAKEYLEQARFLDMRINAKQAQLDSLKSLLPADTNEMSPAAAYEKIIALQEEINRDIDQLVDLKKEIMDVIRRVEKPEYQTLLELRYLCFWTWEKIAMNMHYSLAYTFELHKAALGKISILLSTP